MRRVASMVTPSSDDAHRRTVRVSSASPAATRPQLSTQHLRAGEERPRTTMATSVLCSVPSKMS
jgi:hypothetical protein